MMVRELAVIGLVLFACAQGAAAHSSEAPASEPAPAPPPPIPGLAVAPALAAETEAPQPLAPEQRDRPLSFALLLGYGFTFAQTNGANIYGLGFGVRGGYTLADVIYVGGLFNYWLGETLEIENASGDIEEWKINAMQLGIETAADLSLTDELTLRPMFGFGLAFVATDIEMTETETDAYLSLGVAGLYYLARDIFVGLDAMVPMILAGDIKFAVTLQGTVGMRF
jgi:hypothetical protein